MPKWDFSLKALVQAPWVDLGGGADAKIKLFSDYGYVAYGSKYFPNRHSLDLGGGVITQTNDTWGGVKRSYLLF